MKHLTKNRILSFFLAAIMVFTTVPFPVISAEAEQDISSEQTGSSEVVYDYDTLTITRDGEPITALELPSCGKVDLQANGLTDTADYQWQVLHPEQDDVWVSIYDGTDRSITVTMALVNNVLREDGTAMLRCRATTEDGIYIASPITVTLQEVQTVFATAYSQAETVNEAVTLSDETEETPEFVSITVKYLRFDFIKNDEGNLVLSSEGVEAFTPYIATILYNGDLEATVKFPTIVGYDSYLVDGSDKTKTTSLEIKAEDVTEDIEYTVYYEPAEVKYVVHYFFQNIYDDNYVEDATKTVNATGLTGASPSTADVAREFDGFTPMYYQPDTIAADGSTVFEVYYERNYYLMDFDCVGGYGADPVYVRYGTYISVPNPIRYGWNFAGWDLTESDQEGNKVTAADGVKDDLPETMPSYNTAYTALWERYSTTFTIVYWVQNANDDAYSYAYSLENVQGTTGDVVNLSNITTYKDSSNSAVTLELPDDNALKNYSTFDRTATEDGYDKDSDGNPIVYTLDDGSTATGIQLQGDGSSIVNVYFKRNEYTLKFCYARSYVQNGTTYYQVATNTSGYNNKTTSGTIDSATWSSVSAEPELAAGYTKETEVRTNNGTQYTYYYFTFTAKYQADISAQWPSVAVSSDDYSLGGWCTQYGSGFSNDNSSPIILGPYYTLDFQLIVDPDDTESSGNIAHTMLAYWISDPILMEYWVFVDLLGGKTEYDQNAQDDTSVSYFDSDYINAGDYYYFNYLWGDRTRQYFKKYCVLPVSAEASDNTWSNPRFSIKGMKYHARDVADNGASRYFETTNSDGQTVRVYVFHYVRLDYTFQLDNYGSSFLNTSLKYGTDLQYYVESFDSSDPNNYPDTLEPGAYYFAGWYTGPKGSGMKIVFDSSKASDEKDTTENIWYNPTLQDDNLILFAYWAPVTWEVSFYYDYKKFEDKVSWTHTDAYGKEVTYPITVTHGDLLASAQYTEPTRDGYTFVGWFYLDENGKKRFAPESMEIRQELHLFAEWISSTGVATSYSVSYVYEDSNGTVTEIAATTEGHSTAGKTKTFNAKGNTELYSAYSKGYFPVVASHSILMAELNDDGTTPNTYQFKYIYDEYVHYKVRYVNVATNQEIASEKIASTSYAVITERFLPVSGFVPMPGYYYQTKSLKADGDATEPIAENVITFYYMEDSAHAPYSIEFYLEDASGSHTYGGTNYTQSTSITNTGNLDAVINVGEEFTILDFDGYSFSAATVSTFSVDSSGTVTENVSDKITDSTAIRGTLDKNGLTIRLYYSKLKFDYTIKYVQSGSENKVLHTEYGTAGFGEEISHTAPASLTVDGIQYNYYLSDATDAERTQILTIRTPVTDNPDTEVNETYVNELVFYYKQRQVTVIYKAVCFIAGVSDFGSVTYHSEISESAENLSGSIAVAGSGFRFVGWYSDEACTNQVTTNESFKPSSFPGDTDSVTYYALFEPVLSSLTIRTVVTGGATSNTDNFLFHVKGTGKTDYIDLIVSINGSGSVTLQSLPIGTYTVTELTGWSWEYSLSSITPAIGENGSYSVSSESENIITFSNVYADPDWLGAEHSTENVFAGVYVSQN